MSIPKTIEIDDQMRSDIAEVMHHYSLRQGTQAVRTALGRVAEEIRKQQKTA